MLCVTILLLALVCIYVVCEIYNIDKGYTAHYLDEYMQEYAKEHFAQ